MTTRFTLFHVLSYQIIVEPYLYYLILKTSKLVSWHLWSLQFILHTAAGIIIFKRHFTISFLAQEYVVVSKSCGVKFKFVRYSSAIFDFTFDYIYSSPWPLCSRHTNLLTLAYIFMLQQENSCVLFSQIMTQNLPSLGCLPVTLIILALWHLHTHVAHHLILIS